MTLYGGREVSKYYASRALKLSPLSEPKRHPTMPEYTTLDDHDDFSEVSMDCRCEIALNGESLTYWTMDDAGTLVFRFHPMSEAQ